MHGVEPTHTKRKQFTDIHDLYAHPTVMLHSLSAVLIQYVPRCDLKEYVMVTEYSSLLFNPLASGDPPRVN